MQLQRKGERKGRRRERNGLNKEEDADKKEDRESEVIRDIILLEKKYIYIFLIGISSHLF